MQANRIVPAIVVAAAITAGASALVLAQEEPLVTEATATHIAALSGDNEIPPVTTGATGTAFLAFDPQTNMLRWTVTWDGLAEVTAAHIHGPAAADANADVLIDLVLGEITNPLQGEAELTAEQVEFLEDGLLYVNVHTAANPDGAIRGQIEAVTAAE